MIEPSDLNDPADDALRLTADIVAAFVSNNELTPERLPQVVKSVHNALGALNGDGPNGAGREPAVPINQS
ncbi:MAG: MucR family transcriptional regulator, partial [Pseudomonadota bacterium]